MTAILLELCIAVFAYLHGVKSTLSSLGGVQPKWWCTRKARYSGLDEVPDLSEVPESGQAIRLADRNSWRSMDLSVSEHAGRSCKGLVCRICDGSHQGLQSPSRKFSVIVSARMMD